MAVVVVLGTAGYSWYRYTYPFGPSHCCTAVLTTALISYALEHDGKYPFVEDGPAASLALLIPKYAPLEIVCGKTVDPDEAREYYDRHGTLTSELCGWHCQSGLTTNDNNGIAILWDEVPLAHNGQRTRKRYREVIFLGYSRRSIPESEWQDFLNEQNAFLEEKRNGEG